MATVKIDQRLLDVSEPGEIAFEASRILGEALGAVRVGYCVLDHAARSITVEATWAAPRYDDVSGTHYFSDYGTYIDDLLSGAPVRIADVEGDPRTAPNAAAFRKLGIGAHLDVPIIEGGQVVAQMFVHAGQPRDWTDEELGFIGDIAKRTRTAITRRKAEQAMRTSEKQVRQRISDIGCCFPTGPSGTFTAALMPWSGN